MARMTARDMMKLLGCIIVCLLVGAAGSFFTRSALPVWYRDLAKPSFTPPGWLFPPVWTMLYVLMGVSLFLVWRLESDEPSKRVAFVAFAVQLVLNALWSPAFFGLQSPTAGLIVIVPLWVAILFMIAVFLNRSVAAGLLQVPYLVWVGYAAVLNTSIVMLNR